MQALKKEALTPGFEPGFSFPEKLVLATRRNERYLPQSLTFFLTGNNHIERMNMNVFVCKG